MWRCRYGALFSNSNDEGPLPCPGQDLVIAGNLDNDTLYYNETWIYNITIPDALITVFSSATAGENTIAGAFDIQPRNFQMQSYFNVLNGSLFAADVTKAIQYVFLDNQIAAVEGLIVDTRAGNASIGFRNHTLPQGLVNGAWWTEVIVIVIFS